MTKKILVIDDHYAIRKSFILALLDTEIEVETAATGYDGIELVKKDEVDLVFLDLKMPGINGIDTFREIRKYNRKVPVYFITAFNKEFLDQLQQLIEENYDFELLQKPIDDNGMLELINSIFIDS